jgi:hypothetical protein
MTNMLRALPLTTGRFVDFTNSNHNYPMPVCIRRTFIKVIRTNQNKIPSSHNHVAQQHLLTSSAQIDFW